MLRCVHGSEIHFPNIVNALSSLLVGKTNILSIFQTVMTITGDRTAVSPANVRTKLCVILSRELVSVFQALLDATVRTYVQLVPSEKIVCNGASVGLEDPVIKQLENVYVEMDLLGPCKCLTSLHKWNNNFCNFSTIHLFYSDRPKADFKKHRMLY